MFAINSVALFGQNTSHRFENYNSEDGLSQNSVFTISQTNDGFMWFGTQDGLNRFDGKTFVKYYTDNVIRGSLSSNYILSSFYDDNNKWLWITMKNGINIYEPSTDSFKRIEQIFPEEAILNRLSIKKVFSVEKNKFWFISLDDGLFYIDIEKRKIKRYFESGSLKDKLNALESHNGKIILASLNNLFVLNDNMEFEIIKLPNEFKFTEIRCLRSYANKLWVGSLTDGCWYIENIFTSKAILNKFTTPINEIGCFLVDAKQNIWIGTRGAGLVIYNDATRKKTHLSKIDFDNTSLSSNFVLSMFLDKQGIVWCGVSGGGICKYDPLKYQFSIIQKEPLNENSIADNMIFCMAENDDYVYYGSQNKGLIRYDKHKKQYKNFEVSKTEGIVDNTIYGIVAVGKDRLWLASWSGLMCFDTHTEKISSFVDKTNLKTIRLYTLHKMKQADSLYVTGNFGSIFFSLKDKRWKPCMDKSNWQLDKAVIGRHIYEDEHKTIWIATESDGLIRYKYEEGVFEPKTIPFKEVSRSIRFILPEEDHLWLATDKGLASYNTNTNTIDKLYGKKEGLSSNVCYAIQKDINNNLWISTNNGLFSINRKKNIVKNYNKSFGLSFEEFNTACTLKNTDSLFSFGGVGGIIKFNPLKLEVNNYNVGPIFTSINVNGKQLKSPKNVNELSTIELNYKENDIEIGFTENNFSNAEKNRFAYRLIGANNEWIYSDRQNAVSYTQLNPGDYVFEIKAANSDGLWSKEIRQLAIFIKPPYWQTWSFKLLCFLVICISIYLLVIRRIKYIRHKANIDKQLADYEMKALHTQMNPHFIFNSLGTIKSMILENRKDQANKYLGKFAKMIRLTLNHSTESFISLQQNNEYITHYLEIENLRFNNAFSFEIVIENDIDSNEVKIPPMMIQPLVENAIWHGLLNKEGDKKLSLRYSLLDKKLFCSIEDNGVGLMKAEAKNKTHKSVGIDNIKQRLLLLNEKYKIDCSLTIRDKMVDDISQTGTVATITLPYIV